MWPMYPAVVSAARAAVGHSQTIETPETAEGYDMSETTANLTDAIERGVDVRLAGDTGPCGGPDWLATGWLQRGGLCVLYGEWSDDRTAVAVDCALHAVRGDDWLHTGGGVGDMPERRVLYITTKVHRDTVARSVAVTARNTGLETYDHRWSGYGRFGILPRALNMADYVDLVELTRLVDEEGTDLIVFDFPFQTLGSPALTKEFAEGLSELRTGTGAGILITCFAEPAVTGDDLLSPVADRSIHLDRGNVLNGYRVDHGVHTRTAVTPVAGRFTSMPLGDDRPDSRFLFGRRFSIPIAEPQRAAA